MWQSVKFSIAFGLALALVDATCSVHKGVDYPGNDMGNVAAQADECCAKCRERQGCSAYTWTNYQGGTCWLKSSIGETKANPDAISGYPLAAVCSTEENVDYVGNDVGSFAGASSDCCAKCDETKDCNAYTWTNFNGGTCWLKSGKTATKTNLGAISGTLGFPQTCSVETDVDYNGNDVGSVTGKADECCSKCQEKSGCGAYTWTNFNGGTCWLKSGKGAYSKNVGAISGVVGGSTPAPTTPAPTTPAPTTVTPAPTTAAPNTTAPPTSAPVPIQGSIGKAVADYMITQWPDVTQEHDCGIKCFSLNYGVVPAVGKPKGWEYTYGVPMSGLWKMYEKTGDKRYHDYVKRYVDKYIQENGSIPISQSQDSMQASVLIPAIYEETKEQKYLTAMSLVRKGIEAYPRTKSGAIWHKPANAWEQWLDGLYMTQPFLANYAAKYADNVSAGDSAAAFNLSMSQFKLVHEHLYDPAKKLYYHAWIESDAMVWGGITYYIPPVGTVRSKFFWGRSIAWLFVALMDVLEYLPESHVDRPKLEEMANLLAEGLAAQQDAKTGLWYQILDVRNDNLPANGGYDNETVPALPNWFETSASALFTYSYKKGMRLGVLPCTYDVVAKKGWEGVKTKVVKQGSDVLVQGTIAGMGVGATYNSYVNADFRTDLLHGESPAPLPLCAGPFTGYMSLPVGCKYVYVRDNIPQGVGAVLLAASEMEFDAEQSQCGGKGKDGKQNQGKQGKN